MQEQLWWHDFISNEILDIEIHKDMGMYSSVAVATHVEGYKECAERKKII